MKRKEGNDDGEGNKKARGESSEYKPLMIASVGEHCEGCGIPRHRRETCHLREHPDFNKEGKWVNCSSYKKKKALNVSKGVGEEHPVLKWSEHAGGGALTDPKYTGSRRERERAAERLERLEQNGSHWNVVVLMTPEVASMASPARVCLRQMGVSLAKCALRTKGVVGQGEVRLAYRPSRLQRRVTVMTLTSI